MISEGECDLMQFDCVLGVNLFNEWLYDRKVQDFLPVLDRVRSYIKEIKPRLQWLGKRVSKGGCYGESAGRCGINGLFNISKISA